MNPLLKARIEKAIYVTDIYLATVSKAGLGKNYLTRMRSLLVDIMNPADLDEKAAIFTSPKDPLDNVV